MNYETMFRYEDLNVLCPDALSDAHRETSRFKHNGTNIERQYQNIETNDKNLSECGHKVWQGMIVDIIHGNTAINVDDIKSGDLPMYDEKILW